MIEPLWVLMGVRTMSTVENVCSDVAGAVGLACDEERSWMARDKKNKTSVTVVS